MRGGQVDPGHLVDLAHRRGERGGLLPDPRVQGSDSMTALSRAEPGLPIDWVMESRTQAARKARAPYSLPWSVCKMTRGMCPPRTATAIASAS